MKRWLSGATEWAPYFVAGILASTLRDTKRGSWQATAVLMALGLVVAFVKLMALRQGRAEGCDCETVGYDAMVFEFFLGDSGECWVARLYDESRGGDMVALGTGETREQAALFAMEQYEALTRRKADEAERK